MCAGGLTGPSYHLPTSWVFLYPNQESRRIFEDERNRIFAGKSPMLLLLEKRGHGDNRNRTTSMARMRIQRSEHNMGNGKEYMAKNHTQKLAEHIPRIDKRNTRHRFRKRPKQRLRKTAHPDNVNSLGHMEIEKQKFDQRSRRTTERDSRNLKKHHLRPSQKELERD